LLAPLGASLIPSRDSAAAPAPTSGLAPAPSPLVRLWPMPILTSASQACSACASVLTATNSTPRRPASTMRLTAFDPPPPTPTTLITARYEVSIWLVLLRARRPRIRDRAVADYEENRRFPARRKPAPSSLP